VKAPILREASRLLFPIFVVAGVFLLLRGHHEAGGGFIGGLVTAAGVCFVAIVRGADAGRRLIFVHPQVLVGIGLVTALIAALLPLFTGDPIFTGLWVYILGVKVGTPLLFDMGVYFVVIGISLGFIEGLLAAAPNEEATP
jgi:multicomponent Na+:H+ antiporter subunit B